MFINGMRINLAEIELWMTQPNSRRSVDISISAKIEENKIWAYDYKMRSGNYIKDTKDLPSSIELLHKKIQSNEREAALLTAQAAQEMEVS